MSDQKPKHTPELLNALETVLWILDLNDLPSGQGIAQAVKNAKNLLKKAKRENEVQV